MTLNLSREWLLRGIVVVAITVALLLSVACSSFGLTAPQGAQQSIAYGYSGVTAALTTLAQMTSAGTISSQNAVKANQAILNAKAILDDANAAAMSSAPTAVTILTSATAALAQVSLYLTCVQQKGNTACQL